MDVDTSYMAESAPTLPPVDFQSSAPSNGFSDFFFESLSPRRNSLDTPQKPNMAKKPRSLSPDTSRHILSEATSSPAPPSPSEAKRDRMVAKGAGKPGLLGLGAPSGGSNRPRRPVLSELVPPASGAQSAYPLLSAQGLDDERRPSGNPMPRRAVSAMLPPASFLAAAESDSSFDADGPDMSSPAQAYAARQRVRTIRRRDGTDDFRPLTGASAMVMKESPSVQRYLAPGLPGFGDNEAHGKILPCHRVREDGLMRITPQTVGSASPSVQDGCSWLCFLLAGRPPGRKIQQQDP